MLIIIVGDMWEVFCSLLPTRSVTDVAPHPELHILEGVLSKLLTLRFSYCLENALHFHTADGNILESRFTMMKSRCFRVVSKLLTCETCEPNLSQWERFCSKGNENDSKKTAENGISQQPINENGIRFLRLRPAVFLGSFSFPFSRSRKGGFHSQVAAYQGTLISK